MSKPRKITFFDKNMKCYREILIEQNKYANKPHGTRATGKTYAPLPWHPTMKEKREAAS